MSRIKNIIWAVAVIVFVAFAVAYASSGSVGDDVRTPDYYESKARAYKASGDYGEMKNVVDEGLKHYPDVTGLNELAGAYYLKAGRYDDARYYLFKAVEANKDNVQAKQMLVDVEDKTHNYSSAICYVNELLEVNPYWRGLWRRKIQLYRKQGNDVIADKLLQRLAQIYPNDSTISRELAARDEEEYLMYKKRGDKDAAINHLRSLVERDPKNETYYLDLANLLLQQGNTEEAISVAGRGASNIPGSVALVEKKAGILADEARYAEAIAFVNERMHFNRSGRLAAFRNQLEEEEAAAEAQRDPYVLYGRIYERNHSREALQYLLNTAYTRGYDEDALRYIRAARKSQGNTPSLLYREYMVNKRMGNAAAARSLLSKLYAIQPNNAEVAGEMAAMRYESAVRLLATGDYAEAEPLFEFAVAHSDDAEAIRSAYLHLFACQYALKDYSKAGNTLEKLHARFPDEHSYVAKRADLIDKSGNPELALRFLSDTLSRTPLESADRPGFIASYEEIAVPFIKSLLDAGATVKAYEEVQRLLYYNPSSADGLRFALTATGLLGRNAEYDRYAAAAHSYYPADVAFLVNRSAAYSREGKYEAAVDLLRPALNDYPSNLQLVGAFSENSTDYARSLIKAKDAVQALAVADTALHFDRQNAELLYVKGEAFEALGAYDSAYAYQRFYKPAVAELPAFTAHLQYLQTKTFRNALGFEYLQGRYGEEDAITSIATVDYERRVRHGNTWAATANYASRNKSGEDDDIVPSDAGAGLQLIASLTHEFSKKWNGSVSLGWADKYFPKFSATLGAEVYLQHDWTLDANAGFRRINAMRMLYEWKEPASGTAEGQYVYKGITNSRKNLFFSGIGATKSLKNFDLKGHLDIFYIPSEIYFNFSARVSYFPLDDRRASVFAVGSVGSAPETELIDQNIMPATFDRLNTMVGLGGSYRFNRHISLGLLGTRYTFYTQTYRIGGSFGQGVAPVAPITGYKFRNLYNIHAQVYIYF